MNNPKEKSKLAVGEDGILKETGVKEISVDDYTELLEINYLPQNDWLVIQPLSQNDKEIKTNNGIIILNAGKLEFKCAIVATQEGSKYKRGIVVRLDPMMWGPQGPKVEYIDGKPLAECPEHFIKGVYTNIDLSNWK